MKILFAAPERAWDGFLATLRQHNPDYHFTATGRFQIDTLHGFDVLIPTMSQVTAQLLETADRLSLIQQVGAGLETVDLAAAVGRGICVANVPTDISGNASSVAELGIYLMIGLARDVRGMQASLASRRVGSPLGRALKGKTVGVVGLGGLGRAMVAHLKPFGVRLLGIKQTAPKAAQQALGLDWAGTLADLPLLLGQSDFVILCLPDTSRTHGLMNDSTLAQMKPEAYLINLGRGGLVERAALETALAKNRIAGAGLDVFWQEPPDPDDPIFQYNVLATPHIAGATDVSAEGIRRVVSDNLQRLAQGKPLLYCQ